MKSRVAANEFITKGAKQLSKTLSFIVHIRSVEKEKTHLVVCVCVCV